MPRRNKSDLSQKSRRAKMGQLARSRESEVARDRRLAQARAYRAASLLAETASQREYRLQYQRHHSRGKKRSLRSRKQKLAAQQTRTANAHLTLKNYMKIYIRYVMGSVSQIYMKPECDPSKFYCQPYRRKKKKTHEKIIIKEQNQSELEQTLPGSSDKAQTHLTTIKQEPVAMEPADVRIKMEVHEEEESALQQLYADHEIKVELVVGPVVLHQPDPVNSESADYDWSSQTPLINVDLQEESFLLKPITYPHTILSSKNKTETK